MSRIMLEPALTTGELYEYNHRLFWVLRAHKTSNQISKTEENRSPCGVVTPTNVFGFVPHGCEMEELQPP